MCSVSACWASSFQVNPVKVTLAADKPVAALTVRNLGSDTTVVQLQVVAWSQASGKDKFTPASGILATPPIFTLQPHGTQIVRVGFHRPPSGHEEQAYRLFLQEIPPPLKSGFTGLRMALRISLPVFVQTANAVSPHLHWQAIPSAHGQVEIRVSNDGLAHAKLSQFHLSVAGDANALPMPQEPVYVLPGATHQWVVHVHERAGERLHLTALENSSSPLQIDLVVGDNTAHSDGP